MSAKRPKLSFPRRVWLLLRGVVPLFVVGSLVLAGPTLAVWLVLGGGFRWRYAAIGLGITIGIVVVAGLAFGWALGSYKRGK